MNLEQFLEALEQTPRDWRLDAVLAPNGAPYIRRSFLQCPITSLRNDIGSNYLAVSVKLGMGKELTQQIVEAADAHPAGYDKKLRAKLLKACGLS